MAASYRGGWDKMTWDRALRDDRTLTTAEYAVAFTLGTHADNDTTESFPSIKKLAEECKFKSPRTVQMALYGDKRRGGHQGLIAKGWVEVIERPYASNVYRLRIPPVALRLAA